MMFVDSNEGLGVLPPSTFDAINALATKDIRKTDNEIVEKGRQDATEAPSIWFVNFLPKLGSAQTKLLKEYMEEVLDYRSWTSRIWLRTVSNTDQVPQDGSPGSARKRTA